MSALYHNLKTERDDLRDALAEFCTVARDARGHYGIEECAGPGQPETEWDEIQERLAALATKYTVESGQEHASS